MSDGMRDAERPVSAQKGSAGGPPPLDLAAIEAQLRAFDAMAHGAAITFSAETRALLRLLRETRAALSRYVVASAPSSPLVDQGIRALAQAVE